METLVGGLIAGTIDDSEGGEYPTRMDVNTIATCGVKVVCDRAVMQARCTFHHVQVRLIDSFRF